MAACDTRCRSSHRRTCHKGENVVGVRVHEELGGFFVVVALYEAAVHGCDDCKGQRTRQRGACPVQEQQQPAGELLVVLPHLPALDGARGAKY
jgi:hypothetical protein